jgi:hypothetical protein
MYLNFGKLKSGAKAKIILIEICITYAIIGSENPSLLQQSILFKNL